MSDVSLPIVEVAVPSPLYRCFDYFAPTNGKVTLNVGQRVLVPFGSRKLVAIVLRLKPDSDFDTKKIKRILQVLDSEPVFDTDLMQLLKWACRYYQHPVGDALFTALPVLLRKAKTPSIRHTIVWKLTDAGKLIGADTLKRAPRQALALSYLRASASGLGHDDLPVTNAVLYAMQDKHWITQETALLSYHTQAISIAEHPSLTDAQQRAINTVSEQLDRYKAYLLDGVTGSGKTEVYLQLIAPILAKGDQVLVLVPEIGLTPQLVERFQHRFSINIAVLHSGLNDSQRLLAWQNAASGRALVVLGTRSAIFTPMPRLKMIIVDEEHDASFKQQDGFRYSARDLSIVRAQQRNIPVLLGSATPSLESLQNAQLNRYTLLHLPERAGNANHPTMTLLDVCGQPMIDLLSRSLLHSIKKHLEKHGQVLLFLNRRGFSPVLMCHDCGWLANCRRCDAKLTLHKNRNELRCHHCGNQRPLETNCPDCNSSELRAIGEGTERVEEALNKHFPEYPVLRIDRDTTRRKGQLEKALNQVKSGDTRILLGTQMLAKGHHFPDVTLAAILDTDQGLFSNDFRASERMAQLIVQVAGRAGRAEKPGEVIIQTHHPEHKLLRQLIENDYRGFAEEALQERKDALLPPFSSLALLRAEAMKDSDPREFLDDALSLAKTLPTNDIQMWGPVSAPMERRAGRYRMQLMLQSNRRADLHRLLDSWVPELDNLKSARKVRWSIDVDPIDLY